MTWLSRLVGPAGAAVRGRVRLLLTAGVAIGLLVGGTYAIWSDSVRTTTGRFQAGTVNLKLSDDATGAQQTQDYAITIDNLWPGDPTVTRRIRVHNTGSLQFTLTMSQELTAPWLPAPTGPNPLTVTAALPQPTVTLDPDDYTTVTVTTTFDSFTSAQMGSSYAAWRNSLQGASGVLELTFTATNT